MSHATSPPLRSPAPHATHRPAPRSGDATDLPAATGEGLAEGGSGGRTRSASRAALVGSYLLTVFLLVTLNFALPRALPGDPLSALLTAGQPTYVQSSELRAQLAEFYQLDAPLPTQYRAYLADLATADLGTSIRFNVPVARLIADRLPWTLLLIGAAMTLAVTAGWVAGVHSAWRRGRPVDQGLLALFLCLRGLPAFFLASIAVYGLAVQLDWFPLSGARTRFADALGLWEQTRDIAHHLVLPATVLATQMAAGHYLLMRASMVGELGADYLLLGRAKGLRERRLKYHPYAARNALLPVVTLTALQLAGLVTGAIVVEVVFTYPGMGRLIFDAIEFRDYPTLQGCFLMLSLLVVTANLGADLLYRRLDPRTRS